MQHRISGVSSLKGNGQQGSGTRGRTRGGIRPPQGQGGRRLPIEVAQRMRHPAEVEVLQGRCERGRTQVADGASAMVELGVVMPRVGLDVMVAVAAIM